MTPERVIADTVESCAKGHSTLRGCGNIVADEVQRELTAAGFVIVPREPTRAMDQAGVNKYREGGASIADIYRAMLAASQEPTDGK